MPNLRFNSSVLQHVATSPEDGSLEVADGGPLAGEDREPRQDLGRLLRLHLQTGVDMTREQEQLGRQKVVLVFDRTPNLEKDANSLQLVTAISVSNKSTSLANSKSGKIHYCNSE